jgi:hypothetical protein
VTISASSTAWGDGTEEEMEVEEVVVNIVVPHADLVTLIRIRPWADFERASTIIATLMTGNV